MFRRHFLNHKYNNLFCNKTTNSVCTRRSVNCFTLDDIWFRPSLSAIFNFYIISLLWCHIVKTGHSVAKNRSSLSKSLSQDCSKMIPTHGWSNGVEIMEDWCLSHILFFNRLHPSFCMCQPPCNSSTISKAIKRCSNSRTLKGFIRAVLSTRHLLGRLAVARVTLTNGNWRQEGRRNTRESQSCYA